MRTARGLLVVLSLLPRLKTGVPGGVQGQARFLVVVGEDGLATDARFVDGDEPLRQLRTALLEPGYPVTPPTRSGALLLLGLDVRCFGERQCLAAVAPADRFRLRE